MFKFLLKCAAYLYIFTLLKVFNFFGNLITYTKIIFKGKWGETTNQIKALAEVASTFEGINNYYKNTFVYQTDGIVGGDSIFSKWPTWEPTIRSLVFRQFTDNCDGAVVGIRFLYKEFLKKYPTESKNFTIKKKIIIPYDSFKKLAYRTHFVVEVKNPGEGWTAVYSSGKISLESIETFAKRYEGNDKFIII